MVTGGPVEKGSRVYILMEVNGKAILVWEREALWKISAAGKDQCRHKINSKAGWICRVGLISSMLLEMQTAVE